MRRKQAYLMVCAFILIGRASAPFPVLGFDDGGRTSEYESFGDIGGRFSPYGEPSKRRARSDKLDGGWRGRQPSSQMPAAGTPGRGRLSDGYGVCPRRDLNERSVTESAILLCTQYSIALQECSIALQGIKNEKEPELLSMFQACLTGRNFPTEPSACRRSSDFHDERGR